MRNLGWINYKVAGGKASDPNKIWPIGIQKQAVNKVWGDTPEEAKANYEAILKAHKLK